MHYLFWYLKINAAAGLHAQRFQTLLDALVASCGSGFRRQFNAQACSRDHRPLMCSRARRPI